MERTSLRDSTSRVFLKSPDLLLQTNQLLLITLDGFNKQDLIFKRIIATITLFYINTDVVHTTFDLIHISFSLPPPI